MHNPIHTCASCGLPLTHCSTGALLMPPLIALHGCRVVSVGRERAARVRELGNERDRE